MNFVQRVIPFHLSEDIPVDQPIDIYFFVDLSKGSVTEENIILFNLTEEKGESIRFEYQNRRLQIRPLQQLKPNTHYQIQLVGGRNGLEDITGNKMEETYVSEFYTKENKRLAAPIMISPTDMAEITDDITFQWEPVEGVKYYELEISRSNTFRNLVWPLKKVKIYETAITPHIDYEPGTYYARIRSVGEDGEPSHYSDPIRYYYSGEKQTSESGIKDHDYVIETNTRIQHAEPDSQINALQQHFANIALNQQQQSFRVVNSTPKHKALNLQNVGRITITFNQPVDPESVSSDSIYIIEERN